MAQQNTRKPDYNIVARTNRDESNHIIGAAWLSDDKSYIQLKFNPFITLDCSNPGLQVALFKRESVETHNITPKKYKSTSEYIAETKKQAAEDSEIPF